MSGLRGSWTTWLISEPGWCGPSPSHFLRSCERNAKAPLRVPTQTVTVDFDFAATVLTPWSFEKALDRHAGGAGDQRRYGVTYSDIYTDLVDFAHNHSAP